MTFLAIKVPKNKAESVRKRAEQIGAKDKERLITVEGNYVVIPILEEFAEEFSEFEIIEQENPLFARKRRLGDILKGRIPQELYRHIPRAYKILGDVILVKLSDEISAHAKEIGEALLELHPNCKSVWRDMGKSGALRKPKLEFLAGDVNAKETIKLENGCFFKFDVTKVMFASGNQHEKMRVAKLIREGEVVVDMFAGIGYFSIPIAKHSKAEKIYAIEINPDSYFYLLENMKLNAIDNIIPILGDSKYVTPERVADRVIMGHINCHEFIDVAINALRDKGIIHYHEAVPLAVKNRPIERLKNAAKKLDREIKILDYKKVKNYSPGVVHVVVDAYVV
ncbi:MAG: class I SAM-dependent methyltransferase family protein [Archaeoglobus sp.]|nr:class I SAM-dependent methyltransferase family protein [Archaeoglobus sp.]